MPHHSHTATRDSDWTTLGLDTMYLRVLDQRQYKNHLVQCTEQPWPAPGSMFEKLWKKYIQPVGFNFQEFSNWLEAAEKA
ncbi:unnamed protein product [Caenorhabditis brenneri]